MSDDMKDIVDKAEGSTKEEVELTPITSLDNKVLHVKVGGAIDVSVLSKENLKLLEDECEKTTKLLEQFIADNNMDCRVLVTNSLIDIAIIK